MDCPAKATRGPVADPLAGAVWYKSSYSGTQGNCVEVARNLPGLVAVRDSKVPQGAVLTVARNDWRRFIERIACP